MRKVVIKTRLKRNRWDFLTRSLVGNTTNYPNLENSEGEQSRWTHFQYGWNLETSKRLHFIKISSLFQTSE